MVTYHEEDLFEYYEENGEYLKELFTLDDFLRCPSTRKTLEENHIHDFYNSLAPKIISFFDNLVSIEEREDTHIFTENRAKARGDLINILFNYVAPKNDLNYFYRNPEFAIELLQTKK